MKLTKNLVITARSLWTRCSILKSYMRTIALIWSPPRPCLYIFSVWWTLLPLSKNVIIECPLTWLTNTSLFKVNDKKISKGCDICSKLTIKTGMCHFLSRFRIWGCQFKLLPDFEQTDLGIAIVTYLVCFVFDFLLIIS